MGSGDSSSDESGSDTGPDSSSATTPTCVISPVFGSSNEGKMENTMIGGGGAEGPVAAALNPHEHRNDRWLDIDHFPDGELEAITIAIGLGSEKAKGLKIMEPGTSARRRDTLKTRRGLVVPRTVRLKMDLRRWITRLMGLRMNLGRRWG